MRAHKPLMLFAPQDPPPDTPGATASPPAGGGSPPADTTKGTDDKAPPEGEEPEDWEARYRAQQRVNRDLERKVKGEAGALKAQLEELQAKLDGREAEHAETVKAREVEAAALAKARALVVKAEIRAAAAGKLADPSDALHYLTTTDFEVGDDGTVDRNAITTAISDLVEGKPYLAAKGATVGFESPAGHRKETAGQILNREQLKTMTPEEINAARQAGRLDTLLGTK